MVTNILFIISVVCVVGCTALESAPTRKPFDVIQAAEFSRLGHPLPGSIPALNRKVFRGKRVTITEHAYIANILRAHAHYLTGAILSEQIIITVAHPIYNVPIAELTVVTDQSYNDRIFVERIVMLVITHKEFDPYTLHHDLALLKMTSRMRVRPTRKPILLFDHFPKVKKPVHSQKAWVTGWGRCDWTGNELCLPRSTVYAPDEKQDPMLKTIWFNHSMLKESQYCVEYKHYKTSLGSGMLCVGTAREENNLAPCLAVPGAPLTVMGRLVGLASWGLGCGYTDDLPLVYTDLRKYHVWLKGIRVIIENFPPEHESNFSNATEHYSKLRELEIVTGLESEPPHHRPSELQPAALDYALAQLDADVTDFRDYIYNGILRKTKEEIYDNIRAQLTSKKKVDVTHSCWTPPPKPFLSPTNYLNFEEFARSIHGRSKENCTEECTEECKEGE